MRDREHGADGADGADGATELRSHGATELRSISKRANVNGETGDWRERVAPHRRVVLAGIPIVSS